MTQEMMSSPEFFLTQKNLEPDRCSVRRISTSIHKYSGLAHYKFLKFPESASNPEDVVKIAKQVGLSVLCITDHNSIAGALKAKEYAKNDPDIEVVIGEEVSTRDGEVIGLFLTEEIPMDLSAEETIRRIRKQGGVVLAPHPYSGHVSAIGNLN